LGRYVKQFHSLHEWKREKPGEKAARKMLRIKEGLPAKTDWLSRGETCIWRVLGVWGCTGALKGLSAAAFVK